MMPRSDPPLPSSNGLRRFSLLNPERLALWYFRLNGFLTIPNFVVHSDRGSNIRTDIDVLGVRFPFRRELSAPPMQDDAALVEVADGMPLVVIAEAKASLAALNRSWRDPRKANVERFLGIVGILPPERAREAALAIYDRGWHRDEHCHLTLLAVGAQRSDALYDELPEIPQVTWRHIAEFVFDRFVQHDLHKRSHDQWDAAGHKLWNTYRSNRRSKDEFCCTLLSECGVPA